MGKGITMLWIIISLSILLILAVVYILYSRHQTKKIMQTLDEMLENVENGSFHENCYDESMLASIEERMAKFLYSTTVTKEKVQQEKENVKTLISDIAHQTRTPVANILLYSQLLQEQPLPEIAKKQAEELVLQAQKLEFHLSALLKASRLENDLIEVKPEKQMVLPLLEQVVQNVRSKAESKNISIVLKPTQSEAVFDFKWTSEAMQNIVENAIKYSANEGKISIGVTPYELFCKVDITDEGMGISTKDYTEIFKRFYRAAQAETQEGMGIGLYISREIIEKQSGNIKVSSVVNEGSTFSVFLPMA